MPTPATLIAGFVLDPRGRPVPQARVYLTAAPGPVPDIAALTDAAGAFCLAVPGEGTYTIAGSAEGFSQATATVTAKRGERTAIKLTLGV